MQGRLNPNPECADQSHFSRLARAPGLSSRTTGNGGSPACGPTAHLRCLSDRCPVGRSTPGASIEHKKSPVHRPGFFASGAHGEIRTPDRLVRSQVLYPAELHAHFEGANFRSFRPPCQCGRHQCRGPRYVRFPADSANCASAWPASRPGHSLSNRKASHQTLSAPDNDKGPN